MFKKKFNLKEKNSALIGLVILSIVIAVIEPKFLRVNNLMNILRQVSINGLIALGMTLVILIGGIDLSVGSVFALTSAVTAIMLKNNMPAILAILLSLALGIFLGLVNGILIAYGKLQPFIATLGTMTLFRGLTRVIMDGKPISGFDSSFLNWLGRGYVGPVPVPTIILIIMIVLLVIMTQYTKFGKQIYAIGGNETSARYSAIHVEKVKLKVYMLSSFLASLSGLILLSRLNSSQPTFGEGYELDAIASVVLGGTSMSGGKGGIYGTVIGMLIIGVLNNGLNILNVSSFWQGVVKGLVILIAVLIDRKND